MLLASEEKSFTSTASQLPREMWMVSQTYINKKITQGAFKA